MPYRAKQGFVTKVNGKTRRVARGDVVSSQDPIARTRPDLFDDVEETTRSRPKRRTRKPRPEPEAAESEPEPDPEAEES